MDSSNQPFAVIKFVEHWSLVASHEILEMLVDPFGNRLVAGDSPNTNQGRVEFLVEVCDPSEAADFAYTCNGIVVSDFYTPNYFDPVQSPGVRYSFQGNITEPREVLKGGYLSWHDPTNDTWWQQTFFTGDAPVIVPLGRLEDGGASLRAQIDSKTEKRSHKAIMRRKSVLNRTKKAYQSQIVVPSTRNAQRWRKHIKKLGFKTK